LSNPFRVDGKCRVRVAGVRCATPASDIRPLRGLKNPTAHFPAARAGQGRPPVSSRRRLRSVAHNVADSFLSRNNDAGAVGAFAPLLQRPGLVRSFPLVIALMPSGSSPVFARGLLAEVAARSREMFSDQLPRQRTPRERAGVATLTVRFDLSR